MSKLMVVDDESSICWGISRMAQAAGHDVLIASSAEQALELAGQSKPDAVVLDVRLPGMSGLEAMQHLRGHVGEVPIIIMTAHGDLQTAVEAVRQGAFEYILKPFDLAQIRDAIARALDHRRQRVDQSSPAISASAGILGKSPEMQKVFERIALAAASDVCVLLAGESGTGKELAARAIHAYSARAAQPFVAVNVAALSPSLAESELFGHVRGAFTGAERPREGLLAQADGGTLFLDEVAEIPLPLQVKLLRVLDCGEVTAVGGNTPMRTNFRVISATHQNLLEKVEEGSFRHDLYFRLCAFPIKLPPLRERAEDIPELAEHFAGKVASSAMRRQPVLSQAVIKELVRRPWYGNVRELRNTIEHAVIVARGGAILPDHLPPPVNASVVGGAGAPADSKMALLEAVEAWTSDVLRDSARSEAIYEQLLELVEPAVFQLVLQKYQGQCAAAARQLGLHRTTLRKKLDQYGLGEAASPTAP